MDFLVETVYLVHSIDSFLYPVDKVDHLMNFVIFVLIMLCVFLGIALLSEINSKSKYVKDILKSAKVYTISKRGFMGSYLKISNKRQYRVGDETFTFEGEVEYSYEELVKIIPDMFERYHSEKLRNSHTRGSSSNSSRSSYASQDASLRVAMAFLGLQMNASLEEVKKKYRELAKKYHPDTGGSKEKFIKLNQAYELILKQRSK